MEVVSFFLLSRAGDGISTSGVDITLPFLYPHTHRAGGQWGWAGPPHDLVHSRGQVQPLPLGGVVDLSTGEKRGIMWAVSLSVGLEGFLEEE